VIVGFNASMLFGIFLLLFGAPLIFFLIVIYSRILLEMALVIFRIADQTTKKGEKSESRDGIQWNL
ncbi:MAG: DUF4282 domain-containing protein, partial [Thermodesulfobacteriota bacterium]